MKGVVPLIGIIGIIIALVVVVGAVVVLTSHPSSSNNTSSVSSSNGSGAGGSPNGSGGYGSTSAASTTISSSGGGGVTSMSGGPGQWVMSNSEVSAMAGSGGAYNATGYSNSTYFARYWSMYYANESDVFAGNVTGFYIMSYTVNSSTYKHAIIEFIFQSPKAQFLYHSITKNMTSTNWNVTNATTNGLTYDYVGASGSYGGYYIGSTMLMGWKNQGLVEVIDLGGQLPQAQLASTVAGDIP